MGICADIPCCCNDCIWFSSDINHTFAATRPECYQRGSIETNITGPTNGTGFNGTASNGTRVETAAERIARMAEELNQLQATKRRLYIDVPLMLSKVSGIPSMISTFAVVTVFMFMLIKQPVMYPS
jgi:hypothetical protein